ncbi:MAG: PDZ domain-containing protein, partial [Muribaculaceae bacterium]|nr:PDZ domain-containing protein [Muribaculaceae bacterium]
ICIRDRHEISSGTGDIHLYRNGEFTRLTSFKGNDRNPVWTGPDTYAFVSERDGSLNIYSATVGKPGASALTHFKDHPVRSLSSSADGRMLVFSYDGEIYSLVPGEEPKKVDVRISTDDYDRDHIKRYVTSGASNMAVSPSGEEVAFTLRGDIYVTSVKYKTTRRITDTPAQERCVSFSPDGRTLVYDSDRDGIWQLFTAKIKDDKEKSFAYATEIVEEPLYRSEKTAQQPEFSPDGKKVAFLENRTELRVIDLDTKKVHTALDGKYNYSYADGDISYRWSPDSRWFLVDYIGIGGWNNTDIALVSEDGTKVVDLTESGYSDGNPRWALGGKALTYQSGRYGMKAQGSWGNQSDVMLMVLDGDAWDRFLMSKEEAEMAEKAESEAKEEADKKDEKKDKKKKKDGEKNADAVKPLELDTANRRYRHTRLTPSSARMGDYVLSPKGDKLYYQAPSPEGDYNLYVLDLNEGEVELLSRGLYGGFEPDAKCENLFVLSGSGMKKVNLSSGKSEAIEFEAPYDRKPSLEREYIYDHAWQQVKDKFYDENIHGVDWKFYGDEYRKFLPYIDNNSDFAAMLSELLGELNASHTGARSYSYSSGLPTASLGAYFDPTYEGAGLKVSYIVPRGPLSRKSAGVVPGDVILAIDGEEIAPGADYFPLLEGKAGKKTRLRVAKADGTTAEVTVKPVGAGTLSGLKYTCILYTSEAADD